VIGERVLLPDWPQRTTGAAGYVSDVRLDGTCAAAILRSPHPHAKIRGIDVGPARRMPGVVAVITAADFGDARYHHQGGPLADRPPLAASRVRFVGEEVAAVAAETAEQARAAAAAIKVSYRMLPAVTDTTAALRRRAPRLHRRPSGTNVSIEVDRGYGDASPPPPGAVAVRKSYRFARQAHACMETNGTLASWDAATRRLHVWTSTQSPYFVRTELAHVLGLAIDQVVTHEVAVGGGFGAKSKIGEHEVLAAKLSMLSGRPVRIVLDRAEEFAATKARHEFTIDLRTSATTDGRLLTRHGDLVVDNGAYNHTGPSVMGAGISVLASMYRTRGVHVRARLVDTNKTPGGQFRGYGVPQVTFAIECQMDELADKLGIDPIDLRLANLLREGDVTHAGLRIASTRLAECLRAVRREIDWDAKRAAGGAGRGVGVAATMHVSGARTYPDANRSKARVEIGPGGDVLVAFGGADPGTGQRGLLAQAAATELGVDLGKVTTRMMDSDRTPFDMGSWSSRGTVMGVHAVRKAARAAAEELRRRAGEKFGRPASAVRLVDGVATDGAQQVDIGDLVPLGSTGDTLAVEEEFVADIDQVDPATGVANISLAYSFAAHAVEVEVDQATGQVRVLDYVAAHDTGTAINPTGVEGQIAGGVVMGLGAALGEELLYAGGRSVNPAFLHYPMPRAADLPHIRTVLVQHPDPNGPYGAKSVGEISLNPVAAAVANAVAHATGVRVRDLPLTPDKVRRAVERSAVQRTTYYRLWRRPDRWWISLMRWVYPRGAHHLLHRVGTRFARPRPDPPLQRLERPVDAAGAVRALTGPARPIAGGTDLLPARRQGLGGAPVLVDLTGAADLRDVQEVVGDLLIGGAVTLAEVAHVAAGHGLPVLADTVATIASRQIREVATVGGNLCQQKRCWFFRNGFDCYKRSGSTCPCYAVEGDHRFHHAVLGAHRCQAVTPSDLATTLLALDATVVVQGPAGRREAPIGSFYTGPGEPALSDREIVRAVRVPAAARGAGTAFEKLALWHGDFAVVAACVWLRVDADHSVGAARVALGGVAPVPWRARAVERLLVGRQVTGDLVGHAASAWVRQAHPLRGNAWKIEAAAGLVERALHRAAGAAEPR
jgi:CO/xanthine dehydrogenase Mo-binding subunit/CO/xanthine dehydrogenase FAD-binding subunit